MPDDVKKDKPNKYEQEYLVLQWFHSETVKGVALFEDQWGVDKYMNQLREGAEALMIKRDTLKMTVYPVKLRI